MAALAWGLHDGRAARWHGGKDGGFARWSVSNQLALQSVEYLVARDA
jgi:hypothetical protein